MQPIHRGHPFVITEKGTRLCRPSETVLPLLANPVTEFTKEDGEVVGDTRRVNQKTH